MRWRKASPKRESECSMRAISIMSVPRPRTMCASVRDCGESDCGTELIACGCAPIGSVMRPAPNAETCGCVIEVYSFALEEREVMLPRLYRVLRASGCWTVACRRCGRDSVEYIFEVELGAVMELYCGLVQAGMELTEVSHRALTELCVLRTHERALHGTARVVSVLLRMSFFDLQEEAAVPGVVAASA